MGGTGPTGRQPGGKRPHHLKGSATLKGPFTELETFLMSDVDGEMSDLGAGSYAVVKQLTCKGQKFAAKQLHSTLFDLASEEEREGMLAQFAKECRLLQWATHLNVVKFIGLHIKKQSSLPYLVMEFMKTTLSAYLNENGKPETPSDYYILSDVALGLQFLHKHIPSIIHRDLSANNVLLSSTLQANNFWSWHGKDYHHNRSQKFSIPKHQEQHATCHLKLSQRSQSMTRALILIRLMSSWFTFCVLSGPFLTQPTH